ncbi:YbaB/EbfC family nucleoid-associated protein [Sphingomonas sp. CJ99]
MKSLEDIMAMAQNVQNELQKAQANLDGIEVEGAAGGGLVKVRASAKGRIIGLDIDESLLAPSEKTMLEDLITAAMNDARAKADAAAQGEMSKLSAGIPLPPGFKLPF